MEKLYGTGVALVTPFDKSGQVDYQGLERVLTHTSRGVDYFVVMGTTGEAATLSGDEKRKILEFALSHNPKKLPVVYGIGGNNTQEVLEAIAHTSFNGVTALLSVSPYYTKPSQEGIYRHFVAIADKSPVPVIIYNVPGRTSSNITSETTLRLAAHPNIVGTKEASGNLEQCMKIVKYKPVHFMLISGDDLLTVPVYSIGGVGVISVLANAYPDIFRKMKDYVFAGDFTKARAEQFRIVDLNASMYEEGSPTGVKELMSQLGICGNNVRLPLAGVSEGLRARIAAFREGL